MHYLSYLHIHVPVPGPIVSRSHMSSTLPPRCAVGRLSQCSTHILVIRYHTLSIYRNPQMATRGVIQCQKLTLFYCEHGGSSQAVRDFLSSGNLLQWARERPSVQIKVKVRNGKHPFVKADYLSGVINDRKPHAHQICLRSSHVRNPNVSGIFDQLYNRSGRKITKFTKPVYSQTPSIQGFWTPALNLHLTPRFPMQFKAG